MRRSSPPPTIVNTPTNDQGINPTARRELLEEPFTAISTAYGEQAAHIAAEYLFLQRSLDESLAGLAYPDVADPVGYEQAASAYRAAMRASQEDWRKYVVEGQRDGLAEFNDKTFSKLSGVLNRLVLHPARETISSNIAAGMKFARVPEPGACNWCLMIASRGAVYSKDTVGMTRSTRYHDHCRCIGMEVGPSAPLPRLNRELEAAWGKATAAASAEADRYRLWKNYLDRRSAILQSEVTFPAIPGVEVPTYRGEPVLKGTVLLQQREEGRGNWVEEKEVTLPLPDLHQMPGHVLYGWSTKPPWGRKRDVYNRRPPGNYARDNQFGHRHGAGGGTTFPAEWSDQKIVDSIRDVLEGDGVTKVSKPKNQITSDRQGNEWMPAYDFTVEKAAIIDGVQIRVKFNVVDGVAVSPYAYPVE